MSADVGIRQREKRAMIASTRSANSCGTFVALEPGFGALSTRMTNSR
jgi:hypothetical protein